MAQTLETAQASELVTRERAAGDAAPPSGGIWDTGVGIADLFGDNDLDSPPPLLAGWEAAAARPRRRRARRVDPFEIAVIALMLACALTCLYRLAWAMQP